MADPINTAPIVSTAVPAARVGKTTRQKNGEKETAYPFYRQREKRKREKQPPRPGSRRQPEKSLPGGPLKTGLFEAEGSPAADPPGEGTRGRIVDVHI